LRDELAKAKIKYVYRGKNLGGLDENTRWEESIDELCGEVENGKLVAVMCSEANPNDCHRKSTIEPDIIARGYEVEHILWSNIITKSRNGNAKTVEKSPQISLF
jgi:uncharacterized protein (DUF488 family)